MLSSNALFQFHCCNSRLTPAGGSCYRRQRCYAKQEKLATEDRQRNYITKSLVNNEQQQALIRSTPLVIGHQSSGSKSGPIHCNKLSLEYPIKIHHHQAKRNSRCDPTRERWQKYVLFTLTIAISLPCYMIIPSESTQQHLQPNEASSPQMLIYNKNAHQHFLKQQQQHQQTRLKSEPGENINSLQNNINKHHVISPQPYRRASKQNNNHDAARNNVDQDQKIRQLIHIHLNQQQPLSAFGVQLQESESDQEGGPLLAPSSLRPVSVAALEPLEEKSLKEPQSGSSTSSSWRAHDTFDSVMIGSKLASEQQQHQQVGDQQTTKHDSLEAELLQNQQQFQLNPHHHHHQLQPSPHSLIEPQQLASQQQQHQQAQSESTMNQLRRGQELQQMSPAQLNTIFALGDQQEREATAQLVAARLTAAAHAASLAATNGLGYPLTRSQLNAGRSLSLGDFLQTPDNGNNPSGEQQPVNSNPSITFTEKDLEQATGRSNNNNNNNKDATDFLSSAASSDSGSVSLSSVPSQPEIDPASSSSNGNTNSNLNNSNNNNVDRSVEPRQKRRLFNRILKKAEWNHLFLEVSKVFLRYFLDLALKDIIGKQSGGSSGTSSSSDSSSSRKKLDGAQSELADLFKDFVKTAISNI